jgi:recombination protein RecT
MLGERASSFSNSIINVVSSNNALQKCDPSTVIKSAMISASLNLPIDPALGLSAIVPYKDAAQFQLMYKGVIQLCIRSGQYETIHDTEVYRDELESYNPITGEVKFRELTEYKMRPQHKWEDVVGFYCRFRLLKGFTSSLYMTKEEVMAHAERYSRAYQYDLKFNKQTCPWSTDPIAMGRKTVILALLKRYGIMSVEMQDAVVADSESEYGGTRQVESTTLEPTQGRQSFGFEQKGEQPPDEAAKTRESQAEDQGLDTEAANQALKDAGV